MWKTEEEFLNIIKLRGFFNIFTFHMNRLIRQQRKKRLQKSNSVWIILINAFLCKGHFNLTCLYLIHNKPVFILKQFTTVVHFP